MKRPLRQPVAMRHVRGTLLRRARREHVPRAYRKERAAGTRWVTGDVGPGGLGSMARKPEGITLRKREPTCDECRAVLS